jgi:hypothetical protein
MASLVPSHGLKEFKHSFEETMGAPLPCELDTPTAGPWSQIETAFEVRHLVEHSNGKINHRFITGVPWRQSSWSGFDVRDQEQIEVRREDFAATQAAMVKAARIITDWTSGFWAE